MLSEEHATSGYETSTGIYHSLLPLPTHLPLHSSAVLSLPSYLFSLPLASLSHPCFIDASTGTTLTFTSLRHLVSLAASRLLSNHGLKPHDVVLLVAPNSLYFPVVSLAILSIGAILSPANPLLTRSEFESQITDCSPSLIITTKSLSSKMSNLIPNPLLFIEDFISDLLTNPKPTVQAPLKLPYECIKTSDPAVLMYSSGTTGKSKGVICTHANLISMTHVLSHVWGGTGTGTGNGAGTDTGTRDVYACVLPLFHMFGFSVFVMGVLATGATSVIVPDRFTPDRLMEAVRKYSVTRVPVVPPMVVMMTRKGHVAGGGGIGSLKEVISSGAPLAREHMERFALCFPGVRLSQCYGLTETSGPVTLCDGVEVLLHTSIGRVIPTMEAKIMDISSGESLAPNNIGELCLRGPSVMQGYLRNKEATSLAIDKDGWLSTGDLCYIDSHGCVYVVDRIKELIKYKAYQVAPAELEEILSSHQEIQDVAVTSHPDEEAGEIPMACVVRKSGSKIKEIDIIAFMRDKVAPYKKIRKVIFLDSIPRSPSGKILRWHLRSRISNLNKIDVQARL
ncbi:4-coumarate--CoA ligase-like 4 [Rhynchospora pubera]|uniref:4-coumarate--CoA ligase n=1 Tax=Rhynchospora pubera TaxID=906938 RepID=A0AAV8GAA1_9POAL|nr:4-coumarate--CoA ligase-like 4 [Rhynchospora pubera]